MGNECTLVGRHLTVCTGAGSCGERGDGTELVRHMEKGRCYTPSMQPTVLGAPHEPPPRRERLQGSVCFIALSLVLSRIIRSVNE